MPISGSTEESDARKEGLVLSRGFRGMLQRWYTTYTIGAVGPLDRRDYSILAHSIGVEFNYYGNRRLGDEVKD